MSRIEEKVQTLIHEDEEMQDVIELVLERADEGEVKWVDVRDDISSGQWGRLIEKGILVDGEEGFKIEDRDDVESGLETDSPIDFDVDFDDIETTKWTKYDKGAAGLTLAFFVGYTWQPVRNVIGTAVDVVLGPLEAIVPFYVVIMVIALATGLYSTLLRVLLMDTEKMGLYQSRMRQVSEKRKEAKEAGDDEAMEAIQEQQMEMMGEQLGMFKEQFRPMVWIMFLTIPAFLWMFWKVGIGDPNMTIAEGVIIPFAGEVEWTTGVVGPIQVWIVWYFLCSMAFTQIIQKGLNISMTPTTS